MPFNLSLEKSPPTTASVRLDPVRNVIASMVLAAREEDSGFAHWIHETRDRLTEEERFQHTLVMLGFYHVVAPDNEWASFPEYLDHLANSEPQNMLNRMLAVYARMGSKTGKTEEVDWDSVLTSAESYVSFLLDRFGTDAVDQAVETHAYEYVIDPPAMKNLVIDHLTRMWNNIFETEWKRVEPMLVESVNAFQGSDLSRMDRFEAARFITGQDLDEERWRPTLEQARQVVFIPNAHIGPYVTHLPDANDLIVLFGARQPDNAATRVPELDRADIVIRLSALADDTRLQILQMIRDNGEMRAQEIIEATGLSQPSVSRYLGQLAATGHLQERRVNGAKSYTLNRERIARMLQAVSVFLLGQ